MPYRQLSAASLALLIPMHAAIAQDEAQAQDEKAENTYGLEEVLVTAQKREQALFDVPMAVSAFSGQTLEDMGADNLSDIAASTPGLTVAESAPGVQKLQIRGISANFGKATVGYQLDNISLTSFSSHQPDAATFDLASVEILRGPQGTLYGEGSMGGTIKLQTVKPSTEGWELIAQLNTFSTELGEDSKEANAAINIPVADKHAARLVLGYADIGGYIDQTELNRPDDNYNEKRNARLRYLWDISDTIDLNVMVMEQRIEAGSGNTADENYEQRDLSDIGIEDESSAYSIDLNWELPWFNVLFTNSLFTRELSARFDGREGTIDSFNEDAINATLGLPFALPIGPFEDLLQAAVGAGLGGVPIENEVETDTLVSELRLQGSWDERLYWTAGIFARKQDEFVSTFGELQTIAPGVAQPVADVATTSNSSVVSFFGQVEYDFTSWFNLAVGARYFEEDLDIHTRGIAGLETGGPGSNDATSDDYLDFEAFTPRITASFRAPEHLFGFVDQSMLYLSYARGFRSGGANIRTAANEVPAGFSPDFIDNYEIGGKMIFLDNRISLELAYYEYEWTDVQIIVDGTENGQPGLSYIANAGSTDASGFDWSLVVSPLQGLQLIYSGSHIDTEYTTNTASKIKGDPVDFVPDRQYALAAAYKRHLFADIGGFARADYTFQDDSVQTNRTTNTNLDSDDIRLLNARLGLESERWQLYLYGRNLEGEDGRLAPSQRERSARARPKQVGIQLNFSF